MHAEGMTTRDIEDHLRDMYGAGHWVSDGDEGACIWLNVVTELRHRGVEDVFIVCVDGWRGFRETIQSVFPQAAVQRCVVHQVRNSLMYVIGKDRKAFTQDLRTVYQAPTREGLVNTKCLTLSLSTRLP